MCKSRICGHSSTEIHSKSSQGVPESFGTPFCQCTAFVDFHPGKRRWNPCPSAVAVLLSTGFSWTSVYRHRVVWSHVLSIRWDGDSSVFNIEVGSFFGGVPLPLPHIWTSDISSQTIGLLSTFWTPTICEDATAPTHSVLGVMDTFSLAQTQTHPVSQPRCGWESARRGESW